MVKLKLILFVGSTREERLADRVLKFVKPLVGREHELIVHDPQKLPYETLKKPAYMYGSTTEMPPFLAQAQKEIDEADGFIFLSTEYHSCIPAALTNMTCHFPVWNFMYKPSAIITYSEGTFGGVRASLELRAFTSELGCSSVPSLVCIPETHTTLDENGVAMTEEIKRRLEQEIVAILEQLDWTAHALKAYRSKVKPPPFSHPTRG